MAQSGIDPLTEISSTILLNLNSRDAQKARPTIG